MPANPNTVTLHQWRVIETVTQDGARSRHILGQNSTSAQGRASTAIAAFDFSTMTATTRSGRNYVLEGPPGNSHLGEAAWKKWCTDHGVVSESDVTDEYQRAQGQQADTTVTFTKLHRGARLDNE